MFIVSVGQKFGDTGKPWKMAVRKQQATAESFDALE
jgi:hypothetical protein